MFSNSKKRSRQKMRKVDIHSEGISLPFEKISKKNLKDIVISIFKILKIDNIETAIIVTDNEYIKNINNEYRKKNYPTDVISFAQRDVPFPSVQNNIENLGDIFISIEKAEEQSREYDVTLIDEMKRLLVHGILHLIGYDHEKSGEDEEIMHKKEDEILKNLIISK